MIVCEKKNRSLMFSVDIRVHRSSGETRQASFPTGTADPRVGIVLSPLYTNDGFYLSRRTDHALSTLSHSKTSSLVAVVQAVLFSLNVTCFLSSVCLLFLAFCRLFPLLGTLMIPQMYLNPGYTTSLEVKRQISRIPKTL